MRRRRKSLEKAEATASTVKGLLDAKFISEARYAKWLSNIVLVKKALEKWKMCVDHPDLNIACPKVSNPLSNIDKLVDNLDEYQLVSFMDAYSGYNQVPMFGPDRVKTTFQTEHSNY